MSQKMEQGEETYFLLLALFFNRIFTIQSHSSEGGGGDMTLQNIHSYIYFEVAQANGSAPC